MRPAIDGPNNLTNCEIQKWQTVQIGNILDNPTNTKSEGLSDEIIPGKDFDTINSNQETKTMEVHHHPDLHHKPKPWKEYFLEFILIFLAVTLGFFAENIREHISDKHKTKVFAASLYQDFKIDSASLIQLINFADQKIKNIDSLKYFIVILINSVIWPYKIKTSYGHASWRNLEPNSTNAWP